MIAETPKTRQFAQAWAAFFVAAVATQISFAQTLHIGRGHNGNGTVRAEDTVFAADRFPLTLTLLYHHGKVTINETKLTFVIDRVGSEEAHPDVVFVRVPQGRNWLSADHTFISSGTYKITAFDPGNKPWASKTITVKGADGGTGMGSSIDGKAKVEEEPAGYAPLPPENERVPEKPKYEQLGRTAGEQLADDQRKRKITETTGDPLLDLANGEVVPLDAEDLAVLNFDQAKLAFGTGISKDKLAGQANTFAFDTKGRYIQMLLENGSPIGTDRLIIDVWAKSTPEGEYDLHIGKREVGINPKAKTAYFHFSFFKQGEHKVSIYTKDMIWVLSEYLTIN